jgi:hypothetical protein
MLGSESVVHAFGKHAFSIAEADIIGGSREIVREESNAFLATRPGGSAGLLQHRSTVCVQLFLLIRSGERSFQRVIKTDSGFCRPGQYLSRSIVSFVRVDVSTSIYCSSSRSSAVPV